VNTFKFTNLPKYADGVKIVYSVAETVPENFAASVLTDDAFVAGNTVATGGTLKNVFDFAAQKTAVQVTKKWVIPALPANEKDANGNVTKRYFYKGGDPLSGDAFAAHLVLKRKVGDGAEETVSSATAVQIGTKSEDTTYFAEDGTTVAGKFYTEVYGFSDLPKFDADGAQYTYIVEENPVAGYTVDVDAQTGALVNTAQISGENPYIDQNPVDEEYWPEFNNVKFWVKADFVGNASRTGVTFQLWKKVDGVLTKVGNPVEPTYELASGTGVLNYETDSEGKIIVKWNGTLPEGVSKRYLVEFPGSNGSLPTTEIKKVTTENEDGSTSTANVEVPITYYIQPIYPSSLTLEFPEAIDANAYRTVTGVDANGADVTIQAVEINYENRARIQFVPSTSGGTYVLNTTTGAITTSNSTVNVNTESSYYFVAFFRFTQN